MNLNGHTVGYFCRVCKGTIMQSGLLDCPRCCSANSLTSVNVEEPPKPGHIAPVRESFIGRAPPRAREDLLGNDEESAEVVKMSDVDDEDFERFDSGIWALDRVLDRGLAYGASVIFSGDKGAGKTTLATQIVMEHLLADKRHKVFIGSAEEPIGRFRVRTQRLGYTDAEAVKALSRIRASRERDITLLLESARRAKPSLLLLDSLRKYQHPDVETTSFLTHGPAVIDELVDFTDEMQCFSLIISRLTKSKKIAGSEDLGYEVDALLRLERHMPKGVKSKFVRLLCEKNRLGSEEVQGWFKKTSRGLLSSHGPKKSSGRSKKRSE